MSARLSIWLLLVALLIASGVGGAMAAESRPIRVLTLFSQDRHIPWQDSIDRGLDDELKRSGRKLEFFREYLDAGRFPGGDKAALYESFLRAKYADMGIDVVLAEGLPAGRFLVERPDFLRPSKRLLVNYVGPVSDGSAVMPIGSDYIAAIREVLAVTGARKLVAVADTGDGGGFERLAQFKAAMDSMGGVEVEYLLDISLQDVGDRLSRLSSDTAVFYLLMFRDGRGTRVAPYVVAEELARRSAVPVFSHWTSLLGSGVAGGYMISGERVGMASARTALALAEGRSASEDDLARGAYGSFYDWRQLRRHGISEDRLPAGAELRWRQPSFFDEYRWPIILVLSLTLVLAVSVAVLLRLDVSRRRALAELDAERESLERHVAERTDELTRATESLNQSNQELQQFAYAVSHDLQEPLRSVTAYLQLLDRNAGPALSEESRGFLGFAVDGGRRMHAMIKDLLDYSRLRGDLGAAAMVDTTAALNDALENLHQRIEEAQATVTVSSLPSIQGVAPQLVRLFQNLVGNALKYAAPDRRPEISISSEGDGRMWTFSVTDNGIGIDPEYSDRVFGLFQRLQGRGAYEGNGVGLALCRRIVEGHGGRIWVEGRPGEGCTFRFTLPVVSALRGGE